MIKEMKTGVFAYNNTDYNFNFKISLSAYEKRIFVKTVVNNIVDDNSYDVVLKDLIFDFVIIDTFTNIDTSFINVKDEDGNDIDPIIIIEHFLNETEIVSIVKANMEDGLLDELYHAVDLNIQYITGIHPNPLNDTITSLISTLEKKVDNIDLESMMSMAQKLAGITGDFTVENVVDAYINSNVDK